MAVVGLADSYRYGGNATGLRGADHATGKNPDKKELRKEQILTFCVEPKSLFDIMQRVGLKNRENFMKVYINPMLAAGVLKMTEPDNPTSRNQMYVTAEEAPEHGEA